MGAADMATWRKQNSDKHAVEIMLMDGTSVRGSMLIARDQTIRTFLNMGGESFFDFECHRDGPVVLAKSSIRRVLPEGAQKKDDQAKIDALAARQAEMMRNDPYRVLGVQQGVDADDLRKAYIGKARQYHPDRFADAGLPPELVEYLNAMTRRINGAYEEISNLLEAQQKQADADAAYAQAQAQAQASKKRF